MTVPDLFASNSDAMTTAIRIYRVAVVLPNTKQVLWTCQVSEMRARGRKGGGREEASVANVLGR